VHGIVHVIENHLRCCLQGGLGLGAQLLHQRGELPRGAGDGVRVRGIGISVAGWLLAHQLGGGENLPHGMVHRRR